jgi:hypothetical protein
MAFRAIDTVPASIDAIPVCCIDLGFSEAETSLGLHFREGLAIESAEVGFAEGILRINDWLKAVAAAKHRECALVIEAPLSMALTSIGNPCHRHIELQRSYEVRCAPRSPKGWYYQAGANLCLGSVIFLRELTVPADLAVLLVEGFFCSISPDEAHPSHLRVAQDLLAQLDELRGQRLVSPQAASEGGTVRVLPGLDTLVTQVPGVLLRRGLQLRF